MTRERKTIATNGPVTLVEIKVQSEGVKPAVAYMVMSSKTDMVASTMYRVTAHRLFHQWVANDGLPVAANSESRRAEPV